MWRVVLGLGCVVGAAAAGVNGRALMYDQAAPVLANIDAPALSGACGPSLRPELNSPWPCEWEAPATRRPVTVPQQCCCNVNGTTKCQPHLIVIGAQKAGTTALYSHMLMRPDFEAPPYKEIESLGRNSFNINHYLHIMPKHSPGKFTLDASPGYMVGPLVADRIRDWFPHVRLIAMVRDPVERLFSEYDMYVRRNERRAASGRIMPLPELPTLINDTLTQLEYCTRKYTLGSRPNFVKLANGSFVEESLIRMEDPACFPTIQDAPPKLKNSYAWRGLYHSQLLKYYEVIESERLLVLEMGELEDEPQATMRRVSQFLGVADLPEPEDPEAEEKLLAKAVERTGFTRTDTGWVLKTAVHSGTPEMREALHKAFEPFNEQLFRLLGRSYDWSLKPSSKPE